MAGKPLKRRAMWCGASDAGCTRESVEAFVERAHQWGIDTLSIELKHGDGRISWPSKRFREAVLPQYRDFDLPAELLRACNARDMHLHAWLIDFMEGENGPAYAQHPEWAMLDRKGRPTSEETLRGRRFGAVWMCPAQRPGYTDQWLVPMIEEFASMYAFEAIHHDYVRYPGDLAPDQYCFCDDCLKNIPRFNHLIADVYGEEPFYHELYDREYLESHWEQSPRVLPANWDKLPRHFKSDFLLKGSFFDGGLYDLDYFLYTYRSHWITQFTRDAAEVVRRVRPGMEFSAAVFKNPIHSGRFIGQDWREFAPYVETCMPMDYRDHYPGTFDQYLGLLKSTIKRQKEWAKDYKNLWPGFAVNFLYFEEERALRLLREAVGENDVIAAAKAVSVIDKQLSTADTTLLESLKTWISTSQMPSGLSKQLEAFASNVPKAFWPQEKVAAVIEAIRSTGVEGLTIFCAGQIEQFGCSDTVRKALS